MKRLLVAGFALCAISAVAAAEETRPLKMEVVDRVIEQNDRAVQACGRGGRHDTLAVLVRLEIDAEGRVQSAAPTNASAVAACLARVARRLHFPSSGMVSKVDYPFMLNATLRK
jgi:hypothetical protein